MKPSWNIAGKPAAPQLDFALEHVLVEYDGPQVLTARDQYEERYIGVAVDDSDDGNFVRWAYAQLSDLEFNALMSGGLTVRDALLKEAVYVIDQALDGGEMGAGWRLIDTELPQDILPTVDSFLPVATRAHFAEQDRVEPEIRIAGRHVLGNAIPFADLGAVTGLLQKLWDCLCVGIFYKSKPRAIGDDLAPSTLLAAATAPGSFGIRVRPADNNVFERISQEYKSMLDNSADETSIKGMLRNYSSDVAKAYSEYLDFVELRKVEILAQSRKASTFIGPRKAARIRVHLPTRKKAKVERLGEPRITTLEVRGFFEGYSYVSCKFDFYDTENKTVYSGDIEEGLLTGTPIERGLELRSTKIYQAEIRQEAQDRGKPTHKLLSFWLPGDK